jgi:CheY-like chemotaxis protein
VRILLVDDEADVRVIAKVSLSRLGGMDVVEASSGAEAVLVASTLQPDAIVLDVQMPGQNGQQTFARLRERRETRAIPIIFLTAHSAPADVHALLALGAAAVIVKPFEPASLASEVRSVVESASEAGVLTERSAPHT